jgi:hypothetical protein
MPPVDALRILEIAADRIRFGPQDTPAIRRALVGLRGHVALWRLEYLLEFLAFDVKAEPQQYDVVKQNVSTSLDSIAHELRIERLRPVGAAGTT